MVPIIQTLVKKGSNNYGEILFSLPDDKDHWIKGLLLFKGHKLQVVSVDSNVYEQDLMLLNDGVYRLDKSLPHFPVKFWSLFRGRRFLFRFQLTNDQYTQFNSKLESAKFNHYEKRTKQAKETRKKATYADPVQDSVIKLYKSDEAAFQGSKFVKLHGNDAFLLCESIRFLDNEIGYLNKNSYKDPQYNHEFFKFFTFFVSVLDEQKLLAENNKFKIVWEWLKTTIVPQVYHDTFVSTYGIQFPFNIKQLDEYLRIIVDSQIIDLTREDNILEVVYYLTQKGLLKPTHILSNYNSVRVQLEKINQQKEYDHFKTALNTNVTTRYSIHDVDMMSGEEFEVLVANLFEKMGYRAKLTKKTGDQGIDIIIEKNHFKIGIQTKCISIGSVANNAVQEVVAGLKYYNLKRGMVVTNRGYTKSAIELASANGIQLWDRVMLKEKLAELQI